MKNYTLTWSIIGIVLLGVSVLGFMEIRKSHHHDATPTSKVEHVNHTPKAKPVAKVKAKPVQKAKPKRKAEPQYQFKTRMPWDQPVRNG